MYGTIARLKIKPDMLPQFLEIGQEISSEDRLKQNGFIATYLYQGDEDPNEVWMVVMFESKDAYHRNANSPEQNAQFTRMAQCFAAPPEWHDGKILWSSQT